MTIMTRAHHSEMAPSCSTTGAKQPGLAPLKEMIVRSSAPGTWGISSFTTFPKGSQSKKNLLSLDWGCPQTPDSKNDFGSSHGPVSEGESGARTAYARGQVRKKEVWSRGTYGHLLSFAKAVKGILAGLFGPSTRRPTGAVSWTF